METNVLGTSFNALGGAGGGGGGGGGGLALLLGLSIMNLFAAWINIVASETSLFQGDPILEGIPLDTSSCYLSFSLSSPLNPLLLQKGVTVVNPKPETELRPTKPPEIKKLEQIHRVKNIK